MNLHSIVSNAISSVNPWITVSIKPSTGYTTDANYKQVPAYGATVVMSGQLQPLSYQDLQHLDGLNIQGTRRVLYLNGSWPGVVRSDGIGGDIITLPDNSIWLVAQVLEDWHNTAGWTKVIITLQNNA